MSQSGLRGSKMIQNDHYNMFLTIWRHFGPIWTLLNHFRLNLIFCPKSLWPRSTLCFWGKKSSFVWNDPKKSNWAQNGTKWSKTCYTDHLGLFTTFLDHIGTLASLPCLSTFSPTWAISNPPCAHHRWMAMSKIASKERIFKVSIFVAETSKHVKKKLKNSPKSVCERSQPIWMKG